MGWQGWAGHLVPPAQVTSLWGITNLTSLSSARCELGLGAVLSLDQVPKVSPPILPTLPSPLHFVAGGG